MTLDIIQRNITPEYATELLFWNTNNRPLNKARITQYADDMQHGRWKESGVPIIVFVGENENILEDGQHRLQAIVQANVTVPMTIHYTKERLFDVVDIGMNRPPNIMFTRMGYDNGQTMTRAMNALIMLDIGLPSGQSKYGQQLSRTAKRDYTVAHERDATWLCTTITTLRRGIKWATLPTPCLAALIAIYRVADADATRFVDRLALGENLWVTDGIYRLREQLQAKLRQADLVWYNNTISTWDAFVNNRSLRVFPNSKHMRPPNKPDREQSARVAD